MKGSTCFIIEPPTTLFAKILLVATVLTSVSGQLDVVAPGFDDVVTLPGSDTSFSFTLPLNMARGAYVRRHALVVPALRIDPIDAEELQPPALQVLAEPGILPVIGPANPIRTSAAALLAQSAAIKMALTANNSRRTIGQPSSLKLYSALPFHPLRCGILNPRPGCRAIP